MRRAAKYDKEPLIREVAVTSCMTFTAEPFYLADEPSVARPLNVLFSSRFNSSPVYMPLGNKKGDEAFTVGGHHGGRS